MATDSPITNPSESTYASNAKPLKPESDTSVDFMPKMGGSDIEEPAYYRSLYLLDTIDPDREKANLVTLTEAINPFDKTLPVLKPAFGVLTVDKQVWRHKGLELGNLLHTVCLAPGEVTQVAVVQWDRKTKGASTEDITQSESVSSQNEQRRTVNEVQRAVANEAQWGTSSVFASSTNRQAGAACLWGSASASSTTSTALTAQFSGGSRNLAANSTNAIAETTAEKSSGLRSRRQSVVREVSEEENESLSTRILANYNRRHTLNILFFEVLQRYEVKTEFADWDRCLFVPLEPLDFENDGVIEDHQVQLLEIFNDLGATDMVKYLQKELAGEINDPEIVEYYGSLIEFFKKAKGVIDEFLKESQEFKQATDPEDRGKKKKKIDELRKKYEGLKDDLKGTLKDKLDIRLNNQYRVLPIFQPWAQKELERIIRNLLVKQMEFEMSVGKIFNKHRLFLNQQLWLRMDPYQVYRILQKYKIAYKTPDNDKPQEEPLSALVDPQPVGVFGNYLAFRWSFANTPEGTKAHDKFKETYLPKEKDTVAKTVVLPTTGVFAEAVLGQGLAAEQIDERFAKWGDRENQIPILPPKIAALQAQSRARGMDLTAQDFSSSLAQLRAEKLSDISHIDKIIGQIGKGDMFRDMGGLAQAVTLADKLAVLSEQGATNAGKNATELQKMVLDKFTDVIKSQVGQAVVADYMLPGSGAALLKAQDKKSPEKEEGAQDKGGNNGKPGEPKSPITPQAK